MVAGFPVAHGDRLSRRFIQLTLPKLPPWRWRGTFRHLRAAGNVSPSPPATPTTSTRSRGRRTGAAGGSPAAARRAHERGPGAGLAPARARHRPAEHRRPRLYEAYGFGEREIRRAPNAARPARSAGRASSATSRPCRARTPAPPRPPRPGPRSAPGRTAARSTRGDVLADRELAPAVAEALAVEGHQVDRGQVRLGLHAALAQRPDRLVAVAAVRKLDDEDEPPATSPPKSSHGS